MDTVHRIPAILPITFVVDGDSVAIRTSKGSRLARAAHGAVLALEADEVLVASRAGWSVVVTGEARIETEPVEQRRLDGLLRAWAPGLQDAFIRIPLQVVSGRQLQGIPMAPAAVSPSYGRSAAVEPGARQAAG